MATINTARTVGCMFGCPGTTSVPFVVASLSAGDITVSVTGASDTVSPADVGGEGYVGSGSLTGLQPLTRYLATITQNGNTETQYFWTAPESGDDFCFIFANCDASASRIGSNAYDDSSWKLFANRVSSDGLLDGVPCIGVFFVDDVSYTDSMTINGVAWDGSEASYARSWLNYFGLYSYSDADCQLARESNRRFCLDNLNVMPQYGDHNFSGQDIGWAFPRTDVTASTFWTRGKAAWDLFMGPLQGTGGTMDANANHWYHDLGDVRIMAPDWIYNSDAAVSNHADGTETAITTLLGNNQIDDLLTWAGSSHAFKIMGTQSSMKYVTGGTGERSRGAQHPLKDHCLTEYQRLFTRTNPGVGEPSSFMAQTTTNGKDGSLLVLHGDYHAQHAYRHCEDAYSNNASCWVYEVGIGTVNGSTNAQTLGVVQGTTYEGTDIEYRGDSDPSTHHWGGLLVTCTGSAVDKELEIELSRNNIVMWNKRLIHHRYRNDMLDVNTQVPRISGAESD